MENTANRDLARARHLLRPERARVELRESAPQLPPGELGALAALGFEASSGVAVSVYAFERQDQHAAATDRLKSATPAGSGRVLSGSNGRLLFFGYARADAGPEAASILGRLASAFAGDE